MMMNSTQLDGIALIVGVRNTFLMMNAEDDKSVQDVVDFLVKKLGRLDYAVANSVNALIAKIDVDNYDCTMHINARGILVYVRAQMAAIRKQDPKIWSSRDGTHDIGRGHVFMGITKMAGLDDSAESILFNALCLIMGAHAVARQRAEEEPRGPRHNLSRRSHKTGS
ncbi:hypothetical protein F5X99DRAFT_403776 [Biscogniauxia marginata]|nr:hypothetical protein F5X99DRAFT_403776 [Biscogniauxia marginata]